MAKKSRYQDYMTGLKKLSEKKEKNASPHSVLEQEPSGALLDLGFRRNDVELLLSGRG